MKNKDPDMEQQGAVVGQAAGKQGAQMGMQAAGAEVGLPPEAVNKIDQQTGISDRAGEQGAKLGANAGSRLEPQMQPGALSPNPSSSNPLTPDSPSPSADASQVNPLKPAPSSEGASPEPLKPESPRPSSTLDAPRPEPVANAAEKATNPLSKVFNELVTKLTRLTDPAIKLVTAATKPVDGAVSGLGNTANDITSGNTMKNITGSDGPKSSGDAPGQSLEDLTPLANEAGGTPSPSPTPDASPVPTPGNRPMPTPTPDPKDHLKRLKPDGFN